MRIKIYATQLCDPSGIDEQGYVTLNEGSTVYGLYKKLKVPFALRPFLFCYVNYERAKLTQKLNDGDVVSMVAILSGG